MQWMQRPLSPSADMPPTRLTSEKGPQGDICGAAKKPILFDHLVGAAEQRKWDGGNPERLGSLEIDDQFDFHRLLHG
jgi:hypothetical protein